MKLLIVFSVVTPCLMTTCGSMGVAGDTRFCVKIVFMSGSVPTANDTCSDMLPLFELVDCM